MALFCVLLFVKVHVIVAVKLLDDLIHQLIIEGLVIHIGVLDVLANLVIITLSVIILVGVQLQVHK